jgi:hypothetical protein
MFGGFYSPLYCDFIPGKNQIRLTNELHYYCQRTHCWYHIPVGFESDCASIPQILWSLTGLTPFDYRIRKAAILHDYLYRFFDEDEMPQKLADQIFYDALYHENQMEEWMMQMCWQAVRVGGGVSREVTKSLKQP